MRTRLPVPPALSTLEIRPPYHGRPLLGTPQFQRRAQPSIPLPASLQKPDSTSCTQKSVMPAHFDRTNFSTPIGVLPEA